MEKQKQKKIDKRIRLVLYYLIWAMLILPLTSAFDNFTIAILPDTQKFTLTNESFDNMTQWIADNKDSQNIQMVLHLGDVVSWRVNEEYDRANRSMNILTNASIPYLIIPGNHDKWNDDGFPYNNYFAGKKRSLMNISGFQIGFAGMDWDPTLEEINETKNFIDSNPDYLFIVFTHEYLFDYEYNTTYGWHPEATAPLRIYENLLKNTSNIMFIINGHWSGDRGEMNVRTNHTFYEFMFDYQDWGTSKGEIRLFNFNPNENLIRGSTYEIKTGNETISFNFTYKMNPFLYPNYTYWNETIEYNETIEWFDNETNQTYYNITYFNSTIEHSNLTGYLDYNIEHFLTPRGLYFGYGIKPGYVPVPYVPGDEPPHSSGGGSGGGSSVRYIYLNKTIPKNISVEKVSVNTTFIDANDFPVIETEQSKGNGFYIFFYELFMDLKERLKFKNWGTLDKYGRI